MITNLANKWAKKLVENGANAENSEIFAYGFECAINEIICTVLVFAIAFLIGRPLEMLIWHLFWLPFRLNLGGFHAPSHFWCIFCSTAFPVGCVLLIPFITQFDWIVWVELSFSILIAFVVAPVIHPNRYPSPNQLKIIKKKGRVISIVEAAIISIMFFTCPMIITQTAALGMSFAALLCLAGKLAHQAS